MVAEIHNVTVSDIRKAINRNITRFKESIDFIDLKSSSSDDDLLFKLGYTKQQIIQAQNIYLLSERGYAKPENAIATHVDEDDTLKQGIIDNLGRKQETTLINESGLYALILSSKLPSAKEFKRWVTSEVLPSIRKHSAYMTDETI